MLLLKDGVYGDCWKGGGVGYSRFLISCLVGRNMASMFNCTKNCVIPFVSTLCVHGSSVGMRIYCGRRNYTFTTGKCTEVAKGLKICFAASKPNTIGKLDNLTST